jgi:DNA-binding NtrC family response regulator
MDGRAHILVVEDEAAMLGAVEAMLRGAGLHVHAAGSGEEALALLETFTPDAVLLDLGLPGRSGGELLAALRHRLRHTPVVVLTTHREAEVAVECLKAGAFDYLIKPADELRLLTTVANALRQGVLTRTVASLERAAASGLGPGLQGSSPAMVALAKEIERAADGDRPVLIHGEPGTELEAAARSLHACSSRAAGPFLTVRCALLDRAQQGELLFGVDEAQGRVTEADGGTLYLEDVEALAEPVQERLVAALALAVRARSGALPSCDFRLVASCAVDLAAEVRRKAFRADLYVRLASAEVAVPSLRSRGHDVLVLARQEAAAWYGEGAPAPEFSLEADALILVHPWTRNREELRRVVRRAAELAGARPIRPEDLRLEAPSPAAPPGHATPPRGLRAQPDSLRLADRERQTILAALERSAGSRAAASRELGVSRSTLYRKLKEYGLE